MRILLFYGLLGLCLVCCGRSERGARQPENPLSALPIDSTKVRTAAEVQGWGYQRSVTADLNGDGRAERVVVTADVMLAKDGRPLWEDGHRWAVYAVSDSSQYTLLYAAFVPNGFVESAVQSPDDKGRRLLLIQERTPRQLRSLVVEYLQPNSGRLSSAAYHQIDNWLPGSARLP